MRSLFATTLSACALFAGSASASMPTDGSTLIVQQRTEDGRILLTDRPVAGAMTQRSWTVPGPSPTALPERTESAETGFYGRVPRHIDAQWRSVDDDPVRERIVRETLDRERSQRWAHRSTSPRPNQVAFRGSAAP